MAAWIAVEQESGTSAGRAHVHRHNGYYAGEFTAREQVGPAGWSVPIAPFDAPAGEGRAYALAYAATPVS